MTGSRQSQSHGQPKPVWKGQRDLEAQDRREMNQVKGGGKLALCSFYPHEGEQEFTFFVLIIVRTDMTMK